MNPRKLLLVAVALLAWGLSALPALAAPINFMIFYNLTATTDNGLTESGTFAFNPATNTFNNTQQHWDFILEGAHGGTLGDVGTQTFVNPGINGGNYMAWPDANVNFADFEENSSMIGPGFQVIDGSVLQMDFVESSGTGLIGWGSPSINSDLSFQIANLPMSYSDAPGVVGVLSSFNEWQPGQSENCATCFQEDFTGGTVTLVPNQTLPAEITTPEPASWELFAIGFGLLGGCWWWGEQRRARA